MSKVVRYSFAFHHEFEAAGSKTIVQKPGMTLRPQRMMISLCGPAREQAIAGTVLRDNVIFFAPPASITAD